MRLPARLTALSLAAGAFLAFAPAAQAVQTKTFGLQAQGNRPALTHEADGDTVRDDVVLYNRTDKPLTVNVDVVGATRDREGTFQYGTSKQGLAQHVALNTGSILLAPKESKVLPVRIDAPASTKTTYAAITAMTVQTDASSGPLAVQERLAVIVQFKPTGSDNPLLRSTERKIATGVALVLITVVGTTLWRTRRANSKTAAAVAAAGDGSGERIWLEEAIPFDEVEACRSLLVGSQNDR